MLRTTLIFVTIAHIRLGVRSADRVPRSCPRVALAFSCDQAIESDSQGGCSQDGATLQRTVTILADLASRSAQVFRDARECSLQRMVEWSRFRGEIVQRRWLLVGVARPPEKGLGTGLASPPIINRSYQGPRSVFVDSKAPRGRSKAEYLGRHTRCAFI